MKKFLRTLIRAPRKWLLTSVLLIGLGLSILLVQHFESGYVPIGIGLGFLCRYLYEKLANTRVRKSTRP